MPHKKKNAHDYLTDMLDSAKTAIEYLDGLTFEEFLDDNLCQDAVVRRIEIIGEAAKRVDDSLRSDFTDLAWKEICGMRDFLIHQYDGIDYEIVYSTVESDLPDIVASITKYFEDHPTP